ncbi:MAG: 3-deoxy-manno-octulosonate cytidylyltransferase [Bacteroidales bacterium]|nr:3-deoxy-manno-octulosonate cytidylyltransferase [Bacteroidales bacterium]MCF8344013.1 3-deoxy-manno-octulosonate cytidylyltransferase [Bacteroidales bacterium]MCF8349719.1 3-deoxy-manno-octulosonate cytidylyltransferase [Bacteroidales bacterium]MCF8376680.1 3-deoxy-manno-octulosonate cytidylyltransferase [Bacteroidales bacterium]MCF8401763.1 3-deoxy-manno-octulosonate cytidylyltransferase [Bacteroidales bacterium]
MKIIGIIPARFQSSRFPGKPLADIKGKSMIRRVYEGAKTSEKLVDVWVATDSDKIYGHVIDFGGKAVMTSATHRSGTERCAEALQIIEQQTKNLFDVVINVQGDEPLIGYEQIDQLACCFDEPEVQIATLAKTIQDEDELFNPNVVKVVINRAGWALYFSRSTIPHSRSEARENWLINHEYLKHIGMYAYRKEVLVKIVDLEKSALESCESLEQLRWLDHGYGVRVELTGYESLGIDLPSDIEKIINKI